MVGVSSDEPLQDLWGGVMLDHHLGLRRTYALRRDDGYNDAGHSAQVYFGGPQEFFAWEDDLLDAAEGAVLDVGAGPGRMALWAQAAGHRVVAVEASPLTVKVAVERGVADARLGCCGALERVLEPDETQFGTVLLMGHNLGLGGTLEGLRGLLRALHARTRPGGVLLATSLEFDETRQPEHLRYQAARRKEGRYPGEVVIRVEYAGRVGPWFPWLLIRADDLAALASQTGWCVERIVRDDDLPYGVVLRRLAHLG